MKAVVAAFNQEKALEGAFSVIVRTDCETDGSFYSIILDAALHFCRDLKSRYDNKILFIQILVFTFGTPLQSICKMSW